MERVTLALLLLPLLVPLAAARAGPAAPSFASWPESFTLSYNFSLPYTREFQSSELVYDVVVHRDADRRLAKQSLYSGSNVILATDETYYESTPRIDEVGCAAYKADDESQQLLEAPLLPDLSAVVDEESREPVWVYKGEERVPAASAGGDGTVLAGLWEARARHGERETVYRFWASRGGSGSHEGERGGGKGGGGAAATAAAAAAAATSAASAAAPPPPRLPLLRPLRLHQQGPDMLSGSHFDEYVVDYGELVPGPPPAASFEKPRSCVGVEVEADEGKGPGPSRLSARLAATAASVAPRLPCKKWKRASSSPSSLSSSPGAPPPPSALEENAAFVAGHNGKSSPLLSSSSSSSSSPSSSSPSSSSSSPSSSPSSSSSPSYRVELNRFAALSDAEFAATYLQSESLAARRQRRKAKEEEEEETDDELLQSPENSNKKKKKEKKPFSAELPYSRRVPVGRVPSAVDWRGTGAVPQAVKDQSTCGSCWAFGTAAAVEGATFLASGIAVSASEQQFMDCSWDFGSNAACGGGDADAALDWLVKERRGAFEAEAKYNYLGAAGFCKRPQEAQQSGDGGDSDDNSSSSPSSSFNSSSSAASASSPPRVAGYAFVPAGDDEALKEAVYSRGPLQVSIDAAARGFRFYSSGVYDEPSCSPREEDLDHSVALVGYGTDEASGKDYWLVRNSWSSHWGDGGYVKIARSNGGCGVGTAAMYAVMEEETDERGDERSDEDGERRRELSVA